MADLIDVANTLVNLISGTLYPNGVNNPPITGVATKVFVGWPLPAQLDSDLAAGISSVSVYPRPEERNTTRYSPNWQQLSINNAMLVLTALGQTVTVSGTIPPASNPHNTVIFINYLPYVYQVKPTDTLASVASSLAQLISGATSSGAVITFPPNARIGAVRVGVTGTGIRELRRQERLFQIGIWTNDPKSRDAIASAIDPVLAFTTFITLPDGSSGRLIYKSSPMTDGMQKQLLYRRDLMYSVEYGTTQTEVETQITQEQFNIDVAPAGVEPYQTVATIYE